MEVQEKLISDAKEMYRNFFVDKVDENKDDNSASEIPLAGEVSNKISSQSDLGNSNCDVENENLDAPSDRKSNVSSDKQYSNSSAIEDKILVGVRVRPILESERRLSSQDGWGLDEANGRIYSLPVDWSRLNLAELRRIPDDRPASFSFSKIFGPSSSTENVYRDQALKVVQHVVEGYNGTVMAYGQTTSGKTYTITGGKNEEGVLQYAIRDLFEFIDQKCFGAEFRFVVRVSCCEIYQETINDLLKPGKSNLSIVDDPLWGPSVKGLTYVIVKSPNEALEWFYKGQAGRKVGQTEISLESSRSHTIFGIRLESKPRVDEKANFFAGSGKDFSGRSDMLDRNANILASNAEAAFLNWATDEEKPLAVSTLNIVDLAGSERVSKTKARELQLKEAGSINKSLSAIGNVINAINDGQSHIPYRDSKLTRLLSLALGDNSNTLIICCVSPAMLHQEESRSTLQFAKRASNVQTKARINQLEAKDAILDAFRKQVVDLKRELALEVNEKETLEKRVLELEKGLSRTISDTLRTPYFKRRKDGRIASQESVSKQSPVTDKPAEQISFKASGLKVNSDKPFESILRHKADVNIPDDRRNIYTKSEVDETASEVYENQTLEDLRLEVRALTSELWKRDRLLNQRDNKLLRAKEHIARAETKLRNFLKIDLSGARSLEDLVARRELTKRLAVEALVDECRRLEDEHTKQALAAEKQLEILSRHEKQASDYDTQLRKYTEVIGRMRSTHVKAIADIEKERDLILKSFNESEIARKEAEGNYEELVKKTSKLEEVSVSNANEIERHEQTISSLQMELKTSQEKLNSINTALVSATEREKKAIIELDDWKKKFVEVREQRDSFEREATSARVLEKTVTDCKQLQDRLDRDMESLRQERSLFEKSQITVGDAHKDLDRLREELKSSRETAHNLRMRLNDKDSDVLRLKRLNIALESEVKSLVSTMQKEHETSQHAIESLLNDVSILEERISGSSSMIKQLQGFIPKPATHEPRIKALSDQLEKITQEFQGVNYDEPIKIQEMERLLVKVSEEKEAAKRAADQSAASFEAERRVLEDRVLTAEAQTREQSEMLFLSEAKSQELSEEVKKLRMLLSSGGTAHKDRNPDSLVEQRGMNLKSSNIDGRQLSNQTADLLDVSQNQSGNEDLSGAKAQVLEANHDGCTLTAQLHLNEDLNLKAIHSAFKTYESEISRIRKQHDDDLLHLFDSAAANHIEVGFILNKFHAISGDSVAQLRSQLEALQREHAGMLQSCEQENGNLKRQISKLTVERMEANTVSEKLHETIADLEFKIQQTEIEKRDLNGRASKFEAKALLLYKVWYRAIVTVFEQFHCEQIKNKKLRVFLTLKLRTEARRSETTRTEMENKIAKLSSANSSLQENCILATSALEEYRSGYQELQKRANGFTEKYRSATKLKQKMETELRELQAKEAASRSEVLLEKEKNRDLSRETSRIHDCGKEVADRLRSLVLAFKSSDPNRPSTATGSTDGSIKQEALRSLEEFSEQLQSAVNSERLAQFVFRVVDWIENQFTVFFSKVSDLSILNQNLQLRVTQQEAKLVKFNTLKEENSNWKNIIDRNAKRIKDLEAEKERLQKLEAENKRHLENQLANAKDELKEAKVEVNDLKFRIDDKEAFDQRRIDTLTTQERTLQRQVSVLKEQNKFFKQNLKEFYSDVLKFAKNGNSASTDEKAGPADSAMHDQSLQSLRHMASLAIMELRESNMKLQKRLSSKDELLEKRGKELNSAVLLCEDTEGDFRSLLDIVDDCGMSNEKRASQLERVKNDLVRLLHRRKERKEERMKKKAPKK